MKKMNDKEVELNELRKKNVKIRKDFIIFKKQKN